MPATEPNACNIYSTAELGDAGLEGVSVIGLPGHGSRQLPFLQPHYHLGTAKNKHC